MIIKISVSHRSIWYVSISLNIGKSLPSQIIPPITPAEITLLHTGSFHTLFTRAPVRCVPGRRLYPPLRLPIYIRQVPVQRLLRMKDIVCYVILFHRFYSISLPVPAAFFVFGSGLRLGRNCPVLVDRLLENSITHLVVRSRLPPGSQGHRLKRLVMFFLSV